LGANTIRIYGWDNHELHHDFLNEVRNNLLNIEQLICFQAHAHGLKVLVTYFIGDSFNNPISTHQQQEMLIENFVKQVAMYRDHPAILMWSFGNVMNFRITIISILFLRLLFLSLKVKTTHEHLGNELNGPWNGFLAQLSVAHNCGWTEGCLMNLASTGTCAESQECVYSALFVLVNSACRAAKTTSSRHDFVFKNYDNVRCATGPCTSGLADLDWLLGWPWQPLHPTWGSKVFQYEPLLPDMDAWAVQLYRGRSFGNTFVSFAAQSSKPLVVTEFGVDAFNDPCGWPENAGVSVCMNMWARSEVGGDMPFGNEEFRGCAQGPSVSCGRSGVSVQAEWDAGLAKELLIQRAEVGGVVVGGFVMAWTDEYWKGYRVQDRCNYPCAPADADECRSARASEFLPGGTAGCDFKAHFTCDDADAGYHDLCGYALGSAPDGYVNEEWFGITSPLACGVQGPAGGFHLDSLTLRPVFFALRALWGGAGVTETSSCAELLQCHSCLMQHPQPRAEQLAKCADICLLRKPTPAKASSPPLPVWSSSGFWQDWGTLLFAAAGILVLTIAGAAASLDLI
jgi:hypothetical protein